MYIHVHVCGIACSSKVHLFRCVSCRTIEFTLINGCQSNANKKPFRDTDVDSRIQITCGHICCFVRNGLLMYCFGTETFYLLKELGFVNQYINYTK